MISTPAYHLSNHKIVLYYKFKDLNPSFTYILNRQLKMTFCIQKSLKPGTHSLPYASNMGFSINNASKYRHTYSLFFLECHSRQNKNIYLSQLFVQQQADPDLLSVLSI